jgi:tetraacyldisaccharide 4'-kinase
LLDLLYAQAVGARRRWYERHPDARRRLRQPVISVGNLSVGGTGKTPLVALLAEWLIGRGERPAVLSRGYKRRDRVDGVVVVSDGATVRADLDQAGDEPLMLARSIPEAVVCVCEDRHLAGVLAEGQLGATVHVLDDGFQHVQLARDFDIVITSPGEITKGRVLPFGRLRESRAAAARADFVVVLDADADTARAEAWELGISQFAAARRVIDAGARGASGASGASGARGARGARGAQAAQGAQDARDGQAAPAAAGTEDGPDSVFAVAGIGRPGQFFDMLPGAGYRVAGTMTFPDHHRYDPKDVARIDAAARAVGADVVVTTAKDAVRFEPLGALPFSLVPIRMSLQFDGWDQLTASIVAAIERRRCADAEPGTPGHHAW